MEKAKPSDGENSVARMEFWLHSSLLHKIPNSFLIPLTILQLPVSDYVQRIPNEKVLSKKASSSLII